MAVAHHWCSRPWGVQHIVTAGPSDAPVVSLVHGWPQHWWAWRHVMTALAVDHRVVIPDTRGFGWSLPDPWANPRTTTGGLAADVVAALDHSGGDTAHLVGHDWGGWIAFRTALDHPERVATVSGLAVMPPWFSFGPFLTKGARLAYIGPMALAGDVASRRSGIARWMVTQSTTRPIWSTPEGAMAMDSYLDRLSRGVSPSATQALYRRLATHDIPAALRRRREPRLQVLAQVVLGEHEPIARREVFCRRSHPDEVAVETVEGAGHWLPEEDASETVRLIRGIIARTES